MSTMEPESTNPSTFYTTYRDLGILWFNQTRTIASNLSAEGEIEQGLADSLDAIVAQLDALYIQLRDTYDVLVVNEPNLYEQLRYYVRDLAVDPSISYHRGIQAHVQNMILLLSSLSPDAKQSWGSNEDDGNNLRDIDGENRPYFKQQFDSFKALEELPLDSIADYRRLVLQSQEFLRRALWAANLHTSLIDIHDGIFSETRRPTYIDFTPGTEEFSHGLGERPGLTSLWRKLGGGVDPRNQYLSIVARGKSKEDIKAALKRPIVFEVVEKPRYSSTRVGVKGYMMNLSNAESDIELLHSEANMFGASSPASNKIATRSSRIQIDGDFDLALYRSVIDDIDAGTFNPKLVPKSLSGRRKMLELLADNIAAWRAALLDVKHYTNEEDAQTAKLTAFRIRYLRALYMRLLFSTKPLPPLSKMYEALSARLDDWILYEETLNKSDEFRASILASGNIAFILQDMDDRRTVISRWRGYQKLLAAKATESIEKEAAAGKVVEEEEEEEEEVIVTKPQELSRGRRILYDPIYPYRKLRPSRTFNMDERIERRRDIRRRNFLHKRDVAYLQVDYTQDMALLRVQEQKLQKVARLFKRGGPPNHHRIPQTSDFDMLVYMIIMTQWRLIKARSIL
ncbi:hypothetical protein F5Y04DRAFT_292053 [Hypomontagnella monticulosa]|nr:hypothetical protein F5Y04DRAFT_292053 [Hypomontagnella monticulosa]